MIDGHVGPRAARPSLLGWVAALTALPILAVGMVIWHELGHTATALALGDPTARFHLYLHTSRFTCTGCNLYDSSRLGSLANAAVNAAGVVSTGLLSWLAIAGIGWRRRPRWLPRWLCLQLLVLTAVFDLGYQALQGIVAGAPPAERVGPDATYVDASAVVSFAAQATGASRGAVAALLGLAVAADLGAMAMALRVAWPSGARTTVR